jgi:hypothetical protein
VKIVIYSHSVPPKVEERSPRRVHRTRALLETLFPSVKRKLSARAPGGTIEMQTRQALLPGLAYNIYQV